MNFFNTMVQAMGDRLKAKFDPSSPTFGQGGIVGDVNSAMHPNQLAQPAQQNIQNFTQMPPGAPGGSNMGAGLASSAAGMPMGGFNAPNQTSTVPSADNTPQHEAMARNMGFHSYNEMMAFQRNRQVQNGANPVVNNGGADAGPQVMGTSPAMMHPKNLFNYVLNAWRGATGQ